ncbi:MAG: response regulator [Bacteroidota bacterium]
MTPIKLLLVDDDSENLKVFVNYMIEKNYEIMYAPNGAEGYEIAKNEQPDLILMDWAMPIMNGLEAVLKLKAKTITSHIPIVMATGVMTASEDLQEALEAGATDFVRKPYDKLELFARIQAALRLSWSMKEINAKNQEVKVLMQQSLDQKERELSHMAMTAHEHSEFLRGIQETLKKTLKNPKVVDIKSILKKIKNQQSSMNSWDSFMHHFDNVHPDFLARMKEEGLTINELKLAAYLKIGMNNKEIASLTGVEPGTVKSNLYRMKKRLGLTAETDLREYLIQHDSLHKKSEETE